MKVSMYCDDIRTLVNELETKEDPIQWINLSTEIIKACKNIVETATETALNADLKKLQPELNI